MLRTGITLALSILVLPACTPCLAGGVDPTAHDFAFQDVNPASPTHGQELRLSELCAPNGVVLNFLASWCTYCWDELPHLDELHRSGQARIVGIAADEYGAPLSVVLGLVEKAGLTIPILFVPQDAAAELERYYDHEMLPATYLIDRRGIILETIQGAKPWKALRESILAASR